MRAIGPPHDRRLLARGAAAQHWCVHLSIATSIFWSSVPRHPRPRAVPLRHAREILGREINPTVYSPAEFAKKRAAKDPFLTRVLAKPKLLVLGSEDELG